MNQNLKDTISNGRPESDSLHSSPAVQVRNVTVNTRQPLLVSPGLADLTSSVRESWQSTDSNATFIQGMNLTLPDSMDFRQQSRESMASIATFMTNSSADAIFRRSTYNSTPRNRDLPSNGPRDSKTVSLSDYDMWSCVDDSEISTSENMLPFRCDAHASTPEDFPRPPSFCSTITGSPPETPTAAQNHFVIPESFEHPCRSDTHVGQFENSAIANEVYVSDPALITALPSFSTSAARSASPLPPAFLTKTGLLSVKVIFEDTIVMLRIPQDMPLLEVRRKVYAKVIGQEGLPLSFSFKLAFALTNIQPDVINPSTDNLLTFIESQMDWERTIATNKRDKLTLRITDHS